MRCPDALRDMYAFLDGAVSVERNLDVLGHLNVCPGCTRRFEAERRFEEGLRATLRDEPLPAGLPDRLRAAVDRAEADMGREGEGAPPLRLLRRARPARVAAGAAAAILLAVAAAWATCLGPFQCPVMRGAAEVAERLDRGETSLCVQCGDAAVVEEVLQRRGVRDYRVRDLSSAGFVLEGGAAAVPADPLPCKGAYCEYRSPSARIALVDLPVGSDHRPRSWNRRTEGGLEWYEATVDGRRVVGWQDAAAFHAVVSSSENADLRGVARLARGVP